MGPRFKLDENIPREAEALFHNAGYDCHSILSENLAGCGDGKLIDVCRQEQRVLITLDLDFSDMRLFPPSAHVGIWILRPASQSVMGIVKLIERGLHMLKTEPTDRRLWIVENERVRIRD